ncbi:non-homologous end-joining DNA ligase [Catelliglobosispora koreensis]|uniref:non-homologous end-joining DNA ligase n=1 Tax=Catelliglobosispora koreensis TaxID=129052 RepID=UPI000381DFAE|nr:non-homologous end-joining DNA ligase [Catelliglobosispora koreensis]
MVAPMLATLAPLPEGPQWAYEFKWDGVRAIIGMDSDLVQAISRNSLDFTASYPELTELPRQLQHRSVVLDGEIVALDASGAPSFSLLQQRMHVKTPTPALLTRVPILFYCFDLLTLDGKPTLGWTYQHRREALESLALGVGPMHLSPRFDGPGQAVLETARQHGLEGIIAKTLTSTYQPGARSRNWIKVPINNTQEGIVIGWRPGEGTRAGTIGSLLLAAHDSSGALSFIGAVGTGFTQSALRALQLQLTAIETTVSPATGRPVPTMYARGAHWTSPTLVGEVQFRTWTPEGTMRHPSWRGLRPDKQPNDVTVHLG